MSLMQISDPDAERKKKPMRARALGIDLGTTHSLAAVVQREDDRESVQLIKNERSGLMIPSVVHYLADGRVIVGEEAVTASVRDPQNVIFSSKRLIGRSHEEVQAITKGLPYRLSSAHGIPSLETAAGAKTPIEVSAEILKALRINAEQDLRVDGIDAAVITVPAYFDDAQRQATKDAARLAGMKVLRLLNEPTAAALAYGIHRQDRAHTVAVYDLGGGTFDVSILSLDRGVFRVLATGGDTALGGDDLDRLLADFFIRQMGARKEQLQPPAFSLLLRLARLCKETLSDHDAFQRLFQWSEQEPPWPLHLNRSEFNKLIQPLIDRSLRACRRVLHDARLKPEAIDELVLVGGSTRIPLLRERVAELFKRQPLSGVDPDQVVAVGAAIQADGLAGNRSTHGMLLLDVVPLSLGIETMGGLVERLVPRNTTVPVSRAQEFTTFKDGQTATSIHVVQGERDLVGDCRSLARFELKGIPPMAAGAARILVSFQVDADGLLTVEAEEKTSRVKAGVEVHPTYGLKNEDFEKILLDSMKHSQEDLDSRRLKEQQTEARRTIEALTAILRKDGKELLNEHEYQTLVQAKERLQAALDGNDVERIRMQIEDLEACSKTYLERRINRDLGVAVRGRSLHELS